MKLTRSLFLAGLAVLFSFPSYSQQETSHPTRIDKAVHFRKTEPLRDMKVILPGERDRSWKDGIIRNEVNLMIGDGSFLDALPSGPDPVLQESFGMKMHRGPEMNFDGVGNVNGVLPPDTDGDIGPDHYFQMINLSFAIWDRAGNRLYGPVDNSTLWNGFIGSWTGTNDGDPIVRYDKEADRWLASQFAINTGDGTFWQLIAISETGDPLGAYYQYAFHFPAFNDYPKIGIWPDGYYATFNMFGEYNRTAAAAFERDRMLEGDPDAKMILFDMPEGTIVFNALPSDFDGPPPPDGTPNYMAFFKDDEWGFAFDQLRIWEFISDWDDPASSIFREAFVLQTEPFTARLCEAPRWQCVPQPFTGTQLEAISDRLMYRLQYRNFDTHASMVTNHTVNADGNGKAGVRWYELRDDFDGNGWYIYQQGTYAPDGNSRWMGTAAMNGNGTIALGFSVSSTTVFPSMRYTGRTKDAPPGEMNLSEIEIIAGIGSQSAYHRWGDYAMMSVDPLDDSTFWFTHEYCIGGWKTRICSFNFGPVSAPSVDAGRDTSICYNQVFYRTPDAKHFKDVHWTTSGDGIFQNASSLKMAYLRGPQDLINGQVDLSVTVNGYIPGQSSSDMFTLYIDSVTTVYAGNDTVVCTYGDVPLNGYARNYTQVRWLSTGDGIFTDSTILSPVYFPGVSDTSGGSVELTLMAISEACEDTALSTITIGFDPCFSINEQEAPVFEVTVSPNPSNGNFKVNILGERREYIELSVFGAAGQILFSQRIPDFAGSLEKNFDLGLLRPSLYYLVVSSENGKETVPLIIR